MRKTFILALLALAFAFSASAQSTQRQKMIHMAAIRIAEEIGVADGSKDAFVAMYQEYKKASAEVMSTKVSVPEDPEAAVEQKILGDFEKSEKILQLRKTYYTKFRTILTPSQIQGMYDSERRKAGI